MVRLPTLILWHSCTPMREGGAENAARAVRAVQRQVPTRGYLPPLGTDPPRYPAPWVPGGVGTSSGGEVLVVRSAARGARRRSHLLARLVGS